MKYNYLILLFLIVTFAISSCNNEDEVNPEAGEAGILNTWNLSNIDVFFDDFQIPIAIDKAQALFTDETDYIFSENASLLTPIDGDSTLNLGEYVYDPIKNELILVVRNDAGAFTFNFDAFIAQDTLKLFTATIPLNQESSVDFSDQQLQSAAIISSLINTVDQSFLEAEVDSNAFEAYASYVFVKK